MPLKGKNFIRNTRVYHEYFSQLKNIALSVYEWVDLPETCNARFLEKCLFEYGNAIFVKDPEMSYLNLKVAPFDTINVYEEPTGFMAFGVGYSKPFNANECVYIRNNYMEKSTESSIMMFAERLAQIQLTMDININAQKTPLLIKGDEKQKKSLEAIYNNYDGFKPVLMASKKLSDTPLEVLKTDAPFIVNLLREEKRAVWNECLEFLGINTNPSDKKKERLITSEVESNNEEIQIQAETMFLCRQQACEIINTLFNLNVSVKKRVEKEEMEWRNIQLNLEQ